MFKIFWIKKETLVLNSNEKMEDQLLDSNLKFIHGFNAKDEMLQRSRILTIKSSVNINNLNTKSSTATGEIVEFQTNHKNPFQL